MINISRSILFCMKEMPQNYHSIRSAMKRYNQEIWIPFNRFHTRNHGPDVQANLIERPRATNENKVRRRNVEEEQANAPSHITIEESIVERPNIKFKSIYLECLQPQRYLNDEVVNRYLAHILAEKQRRHNRLSKCLLLDSFILKGLEPFLKNVKYTYSTVDVELCKEIANQKETLINKNRIFDHEFVLLPICYQGHWFLTIIRLLPRIGRQYGIEIQVLDSDRISKEDCNKPLVAMLHLIVASYILHVPSASDNDIHDFMQETKITWPKVPQQTNRHDCGLYLLEFAEICLDSPELNPNWSQHGEGFATTLEGKRVRVKETLLSPFVI